MGKVDAIIKYISICFRPYKNFLTTFKENTMQIAIVGLGVAGNGSLKALIDFKNQHPKQPLTIDIYDESTSLGNGFPYQEDDHKLVMNSYFVYRSR